MKELIASFGAAAATRLGQFVMLVMILSFLAAVLHALFKSRKIQPNGFRWKTFRNEVLFAGLNTACTGFLLGGLTALLTRLNLIHFNHSHAPWWVVAFEYVLYFVLFDTWFYWLHRLMHMRPIYTFVHKIHHFSTSPNLVTTVSVSPLESLINGGFVPIFTAMFFIHDQTMPFIGATNILMGLYVHSGYEFLPRWWNKSWATKWFITATFHDQHHRFFRWNYGGYTTIWDRVCGTMRPSYEAEFEARTARPLPKPAAVTA